MGVLIWIILLAAGVILYYLDGATGHLFRCILFQASTGLMALGALWMVGKFAVISLAVTPFTLTGAALLGIPGVLTMLLIGMV